MMATYCWICGLFAAIRSTPFGIDDLKLCVRSHLQRIYGLFHSALLNVTNFLSDRHQRLAESVELLLVFRFRWFNHQRTADRPRHGWRVKAIIHETFCNVNRFDVCRSLEITNVEDEFMRDETACRIGVERLVVVFELR